MRNLSCSDKKILSHYNNGVMEYCPNLEMVYANWSGSITIKDVHIIANIIINHIETTRAKFLLIDQSEITGTWVQSNQWLLKSWLPHLLKTTIKKIAFVSSKDDFGKYSLMKLIEKINQLDVNAFADFNEALKWLLQKQDEYKIEEYVEILSEENSEKIDLLNKLLTRNKIYRKCDVTLLSVAEMMDMSPKKLSFLINKIFGKNFNELINEYRIKEIIKNLKRNKNDKFTIWGIAHEAGFNTRAAFYRAFKNKTNLSPLQFSKNKRDLIKQ